MGAAKDQMIKEWEQKWKFVESDRFVCAKCFEDDALKAFIRDTAVEMKCSYCKRRSKHPIAAPMNDVLEQIGDGIRSEYGHPDDEGVAVEGGEYVFHVMTPYELFDAIGFSANDAVMEEILDSFSDSAWVQRDFYGLPKDDELRYGWTDFVKAVKHKTRYLFSQKKPKKFSSGIHPARMLTHIGAVINEVGLLYEMKAGTRWYRARQHEKAKKVKSAADLGTVPQKYAVVSNRMSPAGIPMFYGAADKQTALAETFDPHSGKPVVTVGTFETARDMWVLDLTMLPEVPSLFDAQTRHLRSGISFLHDFVEDLTKPIARDGREHIEYVPTQIVTEYIRHIFRPEGGYRIRGIIYNSSRNHKGKCCVLFFRNKQCADGAPGWAQDEKKWLGLVGRPKRTTPAVP